MVTAVTSTTEKRGVVFTFLSRLLYNSKILCKFAPAFRKECKDIKLDSRTITTVLATSEHTLLGLPHNGRRFPIYVCGLW